MKQNDFEDIHTGLKTMAGMVRSYYELLVTTGFTPFEALQLTMAWQNVMAQNTFPKE